MTAVAMLGVMSTVAPTAMAGGLATGGVGIKARAMGGAFRGLADDWSAAAYNPAGLAFIERGELNLTLGTYNPRLTYTPAIGGSGGVDLGFDLANGRELAPWDNLWPIPSFAAVFHPKWSDGLALGGAVYWPHDVNYAWDLYRTPVEYNADFDFHKENYRTDFDVLDIHPVAARKLGHNLAVGVGLSFTDASVILRRIEFVPNPLGYPFDVYPYNNMAGELTIKGRGFGMGANAGVLWKPSPTITIGLSGQLPIAMTVDGTARIEMAWPVNPDLSDTLLNIMGPGNLPVYNRTFYWGNHQVGDVINSAATRYEAPFEFDLDLPGQVAAGVGWKASDRLTVALDLALTFWSAVEAWDVKFDTTTAARGLDAGIDTLASVRIPFGWEDQVRFSAGAEYLARPDLAVRGGVYYDGAAAVDSTFTPNFPDVGGRFGLTAGVAYTAWKNWEFALAQEVAFASGRNISPYGAADGVAVFPGEYALSRYETLLSVSYRF